MVDTKLTALTANTNPAGTDLTYLVDDPSGTPLSQKITVANLLGFYDTASATMTNKTLLSPTIGGAFISGATISGGSLNGVLVSGATISGAYLRTPVISAGFVSGATLTGGALINIFVTGATMSGNYEIAPRIEGGYLTGATLSGGSITGIVDLALADGGTGASDAAGARTNLGLVIGTNVQAWDAQLDDWATKTAPSGTVVGDTDSQTLTNKTLTSPIVTGGFISGATLSGGGIVGAKITGATLTGGAISGIVDLALADGGTGASDAATARTNLGLVIGTDIQAWDADLDTWATKTAPSGTVVGTTDTQTLTAKTLTTPTINGAFISNATINSAMLRQAYIGFGSDATGDMYYRDSAGILARLGLGTTGQVLKANASLPFWDDAAGGGDMSASTYDPANIAEQLVGLTATQTLSNKTLTAPIITGGFVSGATLSGGSIIGAFATGLTISGGAIAGIVDLAIADGGTGASDAATARTNLGLVIGTNVQAYDANLTTWAGKTAPSGTVVGTSDAQTLSSKILTTPVLDGGFISGATLSGGSLNSIRILGAFVSGATLSGGSINGAFITGATLSGSSLVLPTLSGAFITGATLSGGAIGGAFITGATLSGSSLVTPRLVGGFLTGATLSGGSVHSNLHINASLPSDDTYSGISVTLTAGVTLAQWNAGFMATTSKIELADADAIATAGAFALATSAMDANASGIFLLNGIARNDAWTWTVGGLVYLSTTAGGLTQTAPSATDDVIQVVGVALTADSMFWNPQLVQVEHT